MDTLSHRGPYRELWITCQALCSPCAQKHPEHTGTSVSPSSSHLYPKGRVKALHTQAMFPRENVLRNLADKAFNRPICEALLDQRFFNGIGNYLRAEILFRSAGRPLAWAEGQVCPLLRLSMAPLHPLPLQAEDPSL